MTLPLCKQPRYTMDARSLFVILLIPCIWAKAMLEEDPANADSPITSPATTSVGVSFASLMSTLGAVSTVPTSPTENTTAPAPVNNDPIRCTNGKGLPGTCVERVHCDYGTQHIDITLYAPRGYVKLCDIKDVCCPAEYIVKIEEFIQSGPSINSSEDFTFDDDD